MNITHNDIIRVYSGRPGCMCGCNGTYRDGERSKKNMLTRILKGDYAVEFFRRPDQDGTAGCIYTDTATRTQVAYFQVGAKLFEDVDAATLQYEHDNELVQRENLMTGELYWEPRNRPRCCSPSSELFWSM